MARRRGTTDGIRPKALRGEASYHRGGEVGPPAGSPISEHIPPLEKGEAGGFPEKSTLPSISSFINGERVDLERGEEAEDEILITEPVPQVTAEEFFKKSAATPRDNWIPSSSGTLSSRRWYIFGGLAGLLFLLTAVILASTVFAKATLTVKPRVENISLENVVVGLDVSVSKVLTDARVLPAERLTFRRKETQEFAATGKEIIAEKARGKVKIYNSFSSSPQTLIAITRFLTSSGILYRLPRAVTVPGAKIEGGKIVPQFVETELVADKPGSESNLSGEVRLSIPGFQGSPKYDGFYAIAAEGFSGGFEGQAQVVSPDDIKQAEEAVTKKVYEELNAEMSRKAPPGFTFIAKLREIEITKVLSPQANTRVDKFTAEAEAEGRAFFFRESDLISLLNQTIFKGDDSQTLMEETADFTYQIRTADYEKGKAAMLVNGTIKSKAVIPEKEIIMLVKGEKEGSIIEKLKARSELAQFSVSIFPPWRANAPADESKIHFVVQEP